MHTHIEKYQQSVQLRRCDLSVSFPSEWIITDGGRLRTWSLVQCKTLYCFLTDLLTSVYEVFFFIPCKSFCALWRGTVLSYFI